MAREAFFLDFAVALRQHFRDVPLMLTGGFRSREGMAAALEHGHCDIIGLGRPSILNPAFAKTVLLNAEVDDSDARLITAHVEVPWWLKQIGCNFLSGGIESASPSSIVYNVLFTSNDNTDQFRLGVVCKADAQDADGMRRRPRSAKWRRSRLHCMVFQLVR
jgi:tRNA-dihydrouridine synthase